MINKSFVVTAKFATVIILSLLPIATAASATDDKVVDFLACTWKIPGNFETSRGNQDTLVAFGDEGPQVIRMADEGFDDSLLSTKNFLGSKKLSYGDYNLYRYFYRDEAGGRTGYGGPSLPIITMSLPERGHITFYNIHISTIQQIARSCIPPEEVKLLAE
jgi:hypothetical protein